MIEENVKSATSKFENCISKAQQGDLEQQLKIASDEKFDSVKSVKTKSVKLTLILSAFLGLFGAGSFYLGLFKRGICKIVFNVVLPLTLGLIFLFWFAPLNNEYSIQADDINSVIIENEQYGYSFKALTSVQKAYDEAYRSFNNKITGIEEESDKLDSVKNFLLQKAEEIDNQESEYKLFLNSFSDFLQNSIINDLLTEIDNSLAIVESLSEGASSEFDNLTEVFSEITAVYNFLSDSESINEYALLIENSLPKFDNLINTKTFDEINSALNELSPCLKEINQNYVNLSSITKSYIEELKNQMDALNELAFGLQNEENEDIVDTASNTTLGLLIVEFEKVYKEFYEIEISSDNNINKFIDKLLADVDVKQVLDSVNEIFVTENGDGFFDLTDEMKLQKYNFVLYENYFEYLNSDYVSDLQKINSKLPEAKKNAVDNRISLSKTLSETYSIIKSLKSDTDINTIESGIENVVNAISELQSRSNSASYHYWFNYNFLTIYFAILLGIDGIVIVVYWIFDVFRNRDKCQNLNYSNIMQILK